MRLLPIMAWLALAAAPVHASELLRVYDAALANDTQLLAARHARDAALEARPQARAALLPQIEAAYGYQEQSETGTEGFGGSPELPVDRDSTARGLSVTLNQTVFDWTAFKRYEQSADQAALALAQYRVAEQALALRTAQAYFDLLAGADNLRFAQAEKAAVARQLELAQRRFEVGLSAITDVQEAQARHDLAVAQEIVADQQLASSRQGVLEITGSAHASATASNSPRVQPLRDEFPLRLPDPPGAEAWLAAAREGNLELRTARLGADIARTGVSVARGGHLPTVGLQAQYQDQEADGSRFTGENETETLSLQLRVPIFEGLATRSRVNQAQSTRSQREAEFDGTGRRVERQTRDAFLGVMAGAARVRALRQAVVSSTTALEASEIGLEVGTRTAVDVLNAQSILYSAQRDHARSRYDYLLSVLRLKAAAGRLGGRDLEEIDALLVES